MKQKKFWFVMGGILTVLAIVLVLPVEAAAASKYQVLHKFSGVPDGGSPDAGLAIDAAGNLYGTTHSGGTSTYCIGGCGTVFKLAPNSDGTWTESILYSFKGGSDGVFPLASLIFDTAGDLYGTTSQGGAEGTVFELTPNSDGTWTEKVLHHFHVSNAASNGLIFDSVGNLYGTTIGDSSGGVVFRLKPNSDGRWFYSQLHQFCSLMNCADGARPEAGLIFDTAGNLYGTTPFGGASGHRCFDFYFYGCGTVFKLAPNSDGTWTESVLHAFNGGGDGGVPVANLILDGAGNLYGTTASGGNLSYCSGYGCGVVFKLTSNSDGTWKEQVLHRFSGKEGGSPEAGLIFDAAGNLYGTTVSGGPVGGGAVFKLAHNSDGSWAYSVLHVFLGKPAMNSYGSLVLDKAGNLYGTTNGCGSDQNCQGVVFELTP